MENVMFYIRFNGEIQKMYTLMEEHTKRERERDAQPHIHTHRHKRKHTLKQIYHVRLGTNTIMSSWKSMNTQEWS